ncbi:Dps family protein [Fodinicola acaciae]|uniref:Dps family protein n=1 Tax=Fodinicola acaciae TaxID=2681555 RepID=UPI0013D2432F|nr:DNA starvation/stationary phase protection protein [Fodinicola acaciae]
MAVTTIHTDLQDSLVELTDLALQGKQLHWNLVGRGFKSLHEQLDELVDRARTAADAVAERAVTLGHSPDGRALTVAKESPLAAVADGRIADTAAVAHVVAVLTTVVDRMRERIARREDDLVTQDLLIGIVAGLEKQRWMFDAQQS